MDGNNLYRKILDASEWRRENPYAYFKENISALWQGFSDGDVIQRWIAFVEEAPWAAEDAIINLEFILENPPVELEEILEEEGWVVFKFEDEYHFEKCLNWLRMVYRHFKNIYDNPPSTMQLKLDSINDFLADANRFERMN